MKHVKALAIKFVLISAVLFIILGLVYGVDFGEILTVSLVLTLVAYIIGDLLILPRFGNVAATIADFGLAFIVIWALGDALFEENIPLTTAALLSSAIIAGGEWFFHKYVKNQVLDNNEEEGQRDAISHQQLQTEFGSESDLDDVIKANRKTSKE